MKESGTGSEPTFGLKSDFYTFSLEALARELTDYDILHEVGKGSMGIVYEARRKRDGKKVALKVLPPSLTLTDRTIARFLREAELVSAISHPGIVAVFDLGRRGRVHFFAMDFIEGTPLDQRVHAGPLPMKEAARLAVQVAHALHFAHSVGIVHRDLKPANLIQRNDGSVVITDFGLARETGSGSVTESGALVGTPMYMSPEQALGDLASVGTRSDVYGLGATLYELLTGFPPFTGSSAQMVLRAVIDEDPPSPVRLRADLPKELEAIVLKSLEKDPARRYGSALEMAEDLERFLSGTPVLARRPSFAHRAWRVVSRHRIASAAVLLLAVLVPAVAVLRTQNRHNYIEGLVAHVERALALAETTRGETNEPRTVEEVMDFLKQAEANASLLISEEPLSAKARLLRGRAYHRQRRFREALEDFDRCETLAGSPTVLLLHRRIDTLAEIGDAESQRRLLDDLTNLLARDSGEVTRTMAAGYCLLVGVRLAAVPTADGSQLSERWLQKASELYPDASTRSPRALAGRGRIAELRGQAEEAEELMAQAMENADGEPAVLRAVADFFERTGRKEQARLARAKAAKSPFEAPSSGDMATPTPEAVPDLKATENFFRRTEEILGTITRGLDEKSRPASRAGDR